MAILSSYIFSGRRVPDGILLISRSLLPIPLPALFLLFLLLL